VPSCLDAAAWHMLLRTWLALQQLGLAPAHAPAHAHAHAPGHAPGLDARAPTPTPAPLQHEQQHGAAAPAAPAAPAASAPSAPAPAAPAPAAAAAERGAALCVAGERLRLLLADAAAAAQAQPAWRQQALQQLVRRAQPSDLLGGAAATLPVVEQALARLADEMVGLARHNPHAGSHPATAAVQMLALHRQQVQQVQPV
jgi:hypothetical protein